MLAKLTAMTGGSFLYNAGRIREISPTPTGCTVFHLDDAGRAIKTFQVADHLQDFMVLPGFRRVLAQQSGGGHNVLGINLAHVNRIVPGAEGAALHRHLPDGQVTSLSVLEGMDVLMGDDVPQFRVLGVRVRGDAIREIAVNLDHVLDVGADPAGSSIGFVGEPSRLKVREGMQAILDMMDGAEPEPLSPGMV